MRYKIISLLLITFGLNAQTLKFTQIEKSATAGSLVITTGTNGVLTYTSSIDYSKISGVPTLTAYVPYTGATSSVNLGANSFSTSVISFSTDGIAKQNSTTATSTVNGSWWLNSEATNGWQWYLNDATNTGYHTQWKNSTTGFGVYLANAGGTKAQIGTTSNEALGLFVNGGTPKIRIATTGNVGINSTVDPLATFSVSGDVGISSSATVTGNSQFTGSVNIGAGTYGTDNLHQLRVTKGTGTVDIGQFTAGYGTIWMGANTPATTNYAMASNGTNLVLNAPVSNIFMSVANGANLVNVNANTNYFTKPTRIGSSTAPSATLDVTGTMSVSSTATVGDLRINAGSTTDGVKIQGLVGTLTEPAIYFNQATPSSSNYTFWRSGGSMIYNNTTNHIFRVNNASKLYIQANDVLFQDAYNISFDVSTGSKIGTATSQKLSFWNATPIVQPVNTVAIDDVLINTGLRASGGAANFSLKITNNLPQNLKGYTVATLPVGVVGDIAYVTDALAPTYLAAVVGGGAVKVPVFFDGTNWVAH